ncbi:hypothetical protein ZIOFF_074446 (mitochondrion) [Zingiber officinale]|uniref:Uncharacterized protein n=1 Tax=Zingiber officinale TaxID=94328 RepID=A0A8J5BWV5_ZINOF|nr:hypothetical protein ZIOFF_074446 [Zingiber officinale]
MESPVRLQSLDLLQSFICPFYSFVFVRKRDFTKILKSGKVHANAVMCLSLSRSFYREVGSGSGKERELGWDRRLFSEFAGMLCGHSAFDSAPGSQGKIVRPIRLSRIARLSIVRYSEDNKCERVTYCTESDRKHPSPIKRKRALRSKSAERKEEVRKEALSRARVKEKYERKSEAKSKDYDLALFIRSGDIDRQDLGSMKAKQESQQELDEKKLSCPVLGRKKGISFRGNRISFGRYALKALEPAWKPSRQIEAGHHAMTHTP